MNILTTLKIQKGNFLYPYEVVLDFKDGRIFFRDPPSGKSTFGLKDEIKAMEDSRFHGFRDDGEGKVWSAADSHRNRFQIQVLQGENPYEWFDRDLIVHEYTKFGTEGFGFYNLLNHQKEMVDLGLTYHYQVWGAEMGLGKTLAAFAVMMMANLEGGWWVGPAGPMPAIRQEAVNWGLPDGSVDKWLTYDGLVSAVKKWKKGDKAPRFLIVDESQRVKSWNAQRTQAVAHVANAIRTEWGFDGYVILMTGTPSPKSPVDWWAPAEIAWPGFLKEGDPDAFRRRLSFSTMSDPGPGGTSYPIALGWRDNEEKCNVCGQFEPYGPHIQKNGKVKGDPVEGVKPHKYERSLNEVADLQDRLKGLVKCWFKKDCLDLPEKIYRDYICEPNETTLRVAKAITVASRSVMQGQTLLRELSDGFQYRDVKDGMMACPACVDGTYERHYHPDKPEAAINNLDLLSPEYVAELVTETTLCPRCSGRKEVPKVKRISREVPSPKEEAVVNLLDENFDIGRIVFFAGFKGSIDRVVGICHKQGWDTVRVDGRGWYIQKLGVDDKTGAKTTETVRLDNPLEFWQDPANARVAFVSHPKSGGVGLTLCKKGDVPGACMAVFYSNDFDPASRSQAEDRIHRIGMDEDRGAMIVDIMHLPTDYRVRDILRQNRTLELMSMGDLGDDYAGIEADPEALQLPDVLEDEPDHSVLSS